MAHRSKKAAELVDRERFFTACSAFEQNYRAKSIQLDGCRSYELVAAFLEQMVKQAKDQPWPNDVPPLFRVEILGQSLKTMGSLPTSVRKYLKMVSKDLKFKYALNIEKVGPNLFSLYWEDESRSQNSLDELPPAQHEASKERLAIIEQYQSMASSIVRKLFELLTEAAIYPKKSASLNLHIFRVSTREGETMLLKDRECRYERDRMSRNYSLDHIDPHKDKLVVSESFLRDTIIYHELTDQDEQGYNERIRDKIDPAIKWVLSCPLHVPEKQPKGVVCCFGSDRFFKNENERKKFEALLTILSEIDVILSSFEDVIHREWIGQTSDNRRGGRPWSNRFQS